MVRSRTLRSYRATKASHRVLGEDTTLIAQDYSRYSLAELKEALGSVDGRRYPENKAAIEAEIQLRKDSGAYEEEERRVAENAAKAAADDIRFAQRSKPLVAWYLIAGSGLFFASLVLSKVHLSGTTGLVILGVGALYMLGCVVAGVAILNQRAWGANVAIALLALQLLEVVSSTVTLKVVSLLAVYFTIQPEFTIGFSASVGPRFRLIFGEPGGFLIGLNLFTAWLIYLLVKSGEDSGN